VRKIVVTDFITGMSDEEAAILDSSYDVTFVSAETEEDIQPFIKDADALLVWHEIAITNMSFDNMEKCALIVRMGAGYDNVDLDRAREDNIVVSNVPDYGTDVVADHTMALLLNLVRNINGYDNSDAWDPFRPKSLIRLKESSLGIVGLGRIGIAVALRAKAFGLKVQFCDPYVFSGIDKSLDIQRMELDELLEKSDIVSIHAPLTEETRRMIDKDAFEKMKKNCILINTARGEIISLDDLQWALEGNFIQSAGLDVLEIEPPPSDHPLIADWKNREPWLENRLCITPHAAFFTDESFNELKCKGWLTAVDFFENSKIRNCVNEGARDGA
jgi:C-terminal binding protein